MLDVCQLTKRYGGIAVVDRVSFTIRPGEILGYLGPNGAGKSTTVKMIIGPIQPNAGRVLFHGRDVRENLKEFQHRVAYVPEEPHLYPHLSGREIVRRRMQLRPLVSGN
jgi:ABC-2 type transport system ATP-binding protein